MTENRQDKRPGCSKPVITFFIVAICVVAAFLIVGLVKTCTADEETRKEMQIEQEDQSQIAQSTISIDNMN